MEFIWIILIVAVASVILFITADYLMKLKKTPQSAEGFIWNAVYFIQLKQYEKALALLDQMEQEVAITPEEMCDACVQRADANKALGRKEQACDAYDRLYEALQSCEGTLKQNVDLLKEIKDCYQSCDRGLDFEKWAILFLKNENTEE